MEADVALRAGAGETWSMPPTGQGTHVEPVPGRGKKSKAKGRGLPQPVASPSSQHRSRRKQQQQTQQQQQQHGSHQQLRASRSLDDELDFTVEQPLSGKGSSGGGGVSAKAQRQGGTGTGSAYSSREQLASDVQDLLLASGSSARRGSAPGQQSPQLAGLGASKLDKWAPKEQKKSSSRNRRRRAAAAARKQEMGEVGEQQGGEGMAQSPVSPEGSAPELYLEVQAGRGSRLPEPSVKRPETSRQASVDSLVGRGSRKHSQQSDDGFFSYEPDYGLDSEDQKFGPESPQASAPETGLREQISKSQASPGLHRSGAASGFGYQGNGADSWNRRRDKGAMGRMVPKPSGAYDTGPSSHSSDNVPLDSGVGCRSETMIPPEEFSIREAAALSERERQRKFSKDMYQQSLRGQALADPHHGESQSWSSQPSDQIYLGDPSLPPQGPTMFPRSSSSAPTPPPSAAHRDKHGSVVILEVKDRPGLYYKASDRTVSDAPGIMSGDVLATNPAALTAGGLHYHQPGVSPHSMAPPHSMLPPHSMVLPQSMVSPQSVVPQSSMLPPHSMLPPQQQQFYSHSSLIHQASFPQHAHSLAQQHSLAPALNPPTQLTYSPQMNQAPLMSSQPQVFAPGKTIPLDLSFSPRNNSPAHLGAFSHPMAHQEQVQPVFSPAPAHCLSPHSRSAVSPAQFQGTPPGFQSKLPGLRRPNLSALERSVSDDTPLDLSVKKSSPLPSCVYSEPSSNVKGVPGSSHLSPVTPPPLDLRTSFSSSNGASASSAKGPANEPWSSSLPPSAITEQPVSLHVGFMATTTTRAKDHTAVKCSQYQPVQPEPGAAITEQEPVSQTVSRGLFASTSDSNPMPSTISHASEPTGLDTSSVSPPSTTASSTSKPPTGTGAQPVAETETAGFLNKSELLQQRAGIKHDDIVVGPRRPISSLATPPVAKLGDGSTASQPYNTFPPSHAKPGPVQPEEDTKSNNFASPEEQGPQKSVSVPEKDDQTFNKPAQVSTNGQTQAEQASSSSTTDRTATGGSQTIPRRIPRKIQPDSPQNPRKKAGGSRLPKPVHGPSPERKVSLETELSLLPTYTGDEEGNDGSMKQPLIEDKSAQKLRTSGHPVTEQGSSDPKPNAKLKKQMDEDTFSAESLPAAEATPSGKTRQTKAAARSGLSQAVATTPPTKRKDSGSKLHMLSNIPVPMSHDPRPKPALQKRSQSVEDEDEDEASDRTPLLRSAAQQLGVENGHTSNDASKSRTASSSPSSISQTPPPESSFASNASPPASATSSASSSPSASSHINGKPFDQNQKSTREGNGLKRISEQSTEEIASSQGNAASKKPEPGTTEFQSFDVGKNEEDHSNEDQSKSASAARVDPTAKPRLHRSEERLGGEPPKLSVYQSEADRATSTADPRAHVAASVPSSPGAYSPHLLREGSHPAASSASAILDTSTDIEKSPPIVKKKTNLPRIGILRRASDRTAEVCRRGSEHRGIPLSSRRHDPSVEDLKRATSISELCQSVASLLNIDNEKAAAMITGDLSTRQDLVEGLDADAIIDYLCHHGVLDTSALPDIDSKTSPSDRNRALLQQVEGRGTTAVALFVNALRQSGQLHLASSLDTEQRIRPSTSGGYFGKGRHKGEVTVRIEVEFLKILAPRELRSEKVVDASLLNDQVDGVVVKDDEEDEDMVKPRCWCFCLSSRRSKVKGRKKKQQQQQHAMSPPPVSSTDNSVERDGGEERQGRAKKQPKKSKEKNKRKKSSSASARQDQQYQSAKYSLVEPTRGQVDVNMQDSDHSAGNARDTVDSAVGRARLQQQQHEHISSSRHNKNSSNPVTTTTSINGKGGGGGRGKTSVPPHPSGSHRDKSRLEPIIMEYDPHLELVKLRAGQDELASPTRQQPPPQQQLRPGAAEASVGMLVEQWKSSGPHFQRKASQLCTRLVQAARDDLVRHFEQDRGTLVLDVVQDGAAVLVINICMMAAQVQHLKKDVVEAEDADRSNSRKGQGELNSFSRNKGISVLKEEEEEEEEGLLDKLQSILFSQVDIRDFDIRGIKLRLALDMQQVDTALSELS